MSISPLMRLIQPALVFSRGLNCWTAAITRKHRKVFEHSYPTILVKADGSSITIDHHVPRRIIILPFDINLLSEQERKIRQEKRRVKRQAKYVEEIEVEYDHERYLKN